MLTNYQKQMRIAVLPAAASVPWTWQPLEASSKRRKEEPEEWEEFHRWWFQHVCLSIEQWPKPLLLAVCRGLYYPVI